MQMTQPSHLWTWLFLDAESWSPVGPIRAQFPISLQPAEAQLTGAGTCQEVMPNTALFSPDPERSLSKTKGMEMNWFALKSVLHEGWPGALTSRVDSSEAHLSRV